MFGTAKHQLDQIEGKTKKKMAEHEDRSARGDGGIQLLMGDRATGGRQGRWPGGGVLFYPWK